MVFLKTTNIILFKILEGLHLNLCSMYNPVIKFLEDFSFYGIVQIKEFN